MWPQMLSMALSCFFSAKTLLKFPYEGTSCSSTRRLYFFALFRLFICLQATFWAEPALWPVSGFEELHGFALVTDTVRELPFPIVVW